MKEYTEDTAIKQLESFDPKLLKTLRKAIAQGAEIEDVKVTIKVKRFDGTQKYASIGRMGFVRWHDSESRTLK